MSRIYCHRVFECKNTHCSLNIRGGNGYNWITENYHVGMTYVMGTSEQICSMQSITIISEMEYLMKKSLLKEKQNANRDV